MGNGIAQVFAQSGFDVTPIDAADGALERARATIDKSLAKLVEKGKLQHWYGRLCAGEGDRVERPCRLDTAGRRRYVEAETVEVNNRSDGGWIDRPDRHVGQPRNVFVTSLS